MREKEKNSILTIDHIYKSYRTSQGELSVLEDICMEVYENECLCLLGHSGCGKTTLLRIVCGFEKTEKGQVRLHEKPYSAPSRDVIMLFQDFNQLLPWKTVLGNVVHSLCATKLVASKREAKERAEAILREVGLYEFKDEFPNRLSGGMKQRAAFARALVLKPEVLVMDEPFASLDYGNKCKLQKLTKEVAKNHGITILFVTHDMEEAVLMADRIAIMESSPGKIQTMFENSYANTLTEDEKVAMRSKIMEQMDRQKLRERK